MILVLMVIILQMMIMESLNSISDNKWNGNNDINISSNIDNIING